MFIAAILGLGSFPVPTRANEAPLDPLARVCEYGITLALSGESEAAESVFVGLLSGAPTDARALNNLGNIHLWRGDADVALAFYAEAARADTDDVGIVLNEAVALTAAGNMETAAGRADEAVRRAGGPENAARLLGLHYGEEQEEGEAPRGSDRVQLSRAEVLAMLRAAARAVPPDSTDVSASKPQEQGHGSKKPVPAWRTAGPRGSDLAAAVVVYWKY
jgi:Flp pilus assembly protein TadD